MAALPALNRRLRKNRRSSMGCSAAAPTPRRRSRRPADAGGLERRHAGPAVVRRLDDGVEERRQGDDRQAGADDVERRLPRVAEVGTRKRPPTRATAISGRFTRNTEPHQKCSSSQPPATGPMAAPAPASPAQTAMARARSCGGKTLVRIDRVAGITSAAPTPMIPRVTISWPAESAMAARPTRRRRSPGRW